MLHNLDCWRSDQEFLQTIVNSRLSEIALQVVAPHWQHTRSEAAGGGRFNPFWLVRSPPEGIDRVGVKRLLSGISTFLFGILWFAGVILLLIGGAKVGGYVEPWIALFAVILLLIGLPICLLLLIFRKTRVWGGLGIYFLSWPLGMVERALQRGVQLS